MLQRPGTRPRPKEPLFNINAGARSISHRARVLYCRQVGIRSLEPVGVFLPGDQNYPGGTPFDPLGFSQNPDGFVDQAVREVKNGRLAMVAMLGYFVQAAVTRKGPLQNLVDFVADPAHANVFAYLSGSAPQ